MKNKFGVIWLLFIILALPSVVFADAQSQQIAQLTIPNDTGQANSYTIALSKDGNVFDTQTLELLDGESVTISVVKNIEENPPGQLPSAPSGLVASAISESQIDLSWLDSSDDELNFMVERDGVEIAVLPEDSTSYADIGLLSLAQYCYKVRAYNDDGHSGYSNESCTTTLARQGELEFVQVWDSGTLATGAASDTARNQAIDSDYLYVVSSSAKRLAIYDISNIESPILKSLTAMPYYGIDVRKKENYLFVSCSTGVMVYDVANVQSPVLRTTHNLGNYVHGMFLKDNYLYCCQHTTNRFVILDVSNPISPITKGSITSTQHFHGVHDVWVEGIYAYTTCYLTTSSEYGFTVVDVSDASNPQVVMGTGLNVKGSGIIKVGDYLYCGAHSPDTGTTVWNVSNPIAPSYEGRFFDTEGSSSLGYWFADYNGMLGAIAPGIRKLYLLDISVPDFPAIKTLVVLGTIARPSNVVVIDDYFFLSCVDESTRGWHLRLYKAVAN